MMMQFDTHFPNGVETTKLKMFFSQQKEEKDAIFGTQPKNFQVELWWDFGSSAGWWSGKPSASDFTQKWAVVIEDWG